MASPSLGKRCFLSFLVPLSVVEIVKKHFSVRPDTGRTFGIDLKTTY